MAAHPVVSDTGREPPVPVDEPRRKDVNRDADADTARKDRRAFAAGPPPMTDGDSFDRILASLWEAALDDSLWPAAAVAIDEACAIKGNNLVVARQDGGDGAQLLFQAGYHRGEPRPDFDRDYVENYYATDERVPRMMRLADLQWAPMRALYSDAERKTSPTYNEAMPRYGAQDGLNARMNGPEGSLIFWIPFDPVHSGGWESERLATVDRLLPHIRRFVRVRQALADAGALRETLAGLLDNTAVGIVQLDWRGRIVEANERAAAHFRNGAGLTDLGGFAGARRPADNARLGRMLARALPGNGAPVAGSMTVARPPGLPPLTLHVCPVPARRTAFGLHRVAALLLIVDPAAVRVEPEAVAAALDLTRAESRVAASLAEGMSVRDIAAASGRAESTVRWTVKRIHARLGISRQADLVRTVLSAAAAPWPRNAEGTSPQR